MSDVKELKKYLDCYDCYDQCLRKLDQDNSTNCFLLKFFCEEWKKEKEKLKEKDDLINRLVENLYISKLNNQNNPQSNELLTNSVHKPNLDSLTLKNEFNLKENLNSGDPIILREDKYDELQKYIMAKKKRVVVVRGTSGLGKTSFIKTLEFLLKKKKTNIIEIWSKDCLTDFNIDAIFTKLNSLQEISNEELLKGEIHIIIDEIHKLKDKYIDLLQSIKSLFDKKNNIYFYIFGVLTDVETENKEIKDMLSPIVLKGKDKDFLKFDRKEFFDLIDLLLSVKINQNYSNEQKLITLSKAILVPETIEIIYKYTEGHPCLVNELVTYLKQEFLNFEISSEMDVNSVNSWLENEIVGSKFLEYSKNNVKSYLCFTKLEKNNVFKDAGKVLVELLIHKNIMITKYKSGTIESNSLKSLKIHGLIDIVNDEYYRFPSFLFGIAVTFYFTGSIDGLKIRKDDDKTKILVKIVTYMNIIIEQNNYYNMICERGNFLEQDWKILFVQSLIQLLPSELSYLLLFEVDKEVMHLTNLSKNAKADIYLNSNFRIVFELCIALPVEHVCRKYLTKYSELFGKLSDSKRKEIGASYNFKDNIKYLVVHFSPKNSKPEVEEELEDISTINVNVNRKSSRVPVVNKKYYNPDLNNMLANFKNDLISDFENIEFSIDHDTKTMVLELSKNKERFFKNLKGMLNLN